MGETGYEHDISPPWTLFNMVMALNIGMLILPCIHRTANRGKPTIMVNNRATYQQQSYSQATRERMQAVFIPVTYDKNHPVPDIVEEHRVYFNPHIISLMFTSGPTIHLTEPIHQPDTWDVHLATEPNAHNVDQSVHDELKIPITDIDDGRINYCSTCWGCTPPMSYSSWGTS